jgi:tetratricopeptide (TPR) repeat protein
MASSKAERQLSEAKSAIHHGDLQRARVLLTSLVKTDRDNPEVWLWLSAVVDSHKERKACLEQALKYDPHMEIAQRALASLGDETYRKKFRVPFAQQRQDWESALAVPKYNHLQQLMMTGVWRPVVMVLGVLMVVGLLALAGWGISSWLNRPTYSLGELRTSTPSPTATARPHEYLFFNLDDLTAQTPLADLIAKTTTPMPTMTPYVALSFSQYEYNRSAMYAYARQDWESMERNLLSLVEEEPQAHDVHYYLGVAYLNQGKFEEAQQSFEQSLTIEEDYAPAYWGLAQVILMSNDEERYPLAEEHLLAAYALDRNMPDVSLALADFYVRQEAYETALPYLAQAEKLLPADNRVMLTYMQLYEQLGQPEKELEYALKAQQADGTRVETYRRMGELFMQLGQYSQALEPLRIYLTYEPKADALYWAWLGFCYGEVDFVEEAETAFAQAFDIAPEDDTITYWLARFHYSQENYEEALVYFREILRKESRSYDYNLWTGLTHTAMRECSRALHYYSQALANGQTVRDTAIVHYNRGRCYHLLGYDILAERDMEALLALPYDLLQGEWVEYAIEVLKPSPSALRTMQAEGLPRVTPSPTATRTTTVSPTVTATQSDD